METETDARLEALVEEVVNLRFPDDEPLPPEPTPQQVLGELARLRGRTDRVERILGTLTRLRARAQGARASAEATYKDAWDRASASSRRGGATEYLGPRERYADHDLSAMAELRAFRASEKDAQRVDECYEMARLFHRGMDGRRQELLAILRTFTLESRLEREH